MLFFCFVFAFVLHLLLAGAFSNRNFGALVLLFVRILIKSMIPGFYMQMND